MRILTAVVLASFWAAWLPAEAQNRSDNTDACVLALQTAASRNDWSLEELITLTESCIVAGQAAAAERVLLAEHDATADVRVRLQLIEPLKWAADSAGSSLVLAKVFADRRDAHRESAIAWLELAEIGAQSYPAQREYLAEAAKLALGDAPLLSEIVDRQEEEGFWSDALSTAESWAQRHPTLQARCRLASLHLIAGDAARAGELAAQLIKDPQLDAGDLQELVQVACEMRDWQHAAAWLAKALPRFPRHLGLLSLHAVATEEAGRSADAVAAFLRLLEIREAQAPDARAVAMSGGRYLAAVRNRKWIDQPAGARDFALLDDWTALAYAHRAAPERSRREQGPERTVHLPASIEEARAFALLHLRGLAAGGANVPEQVLTQALAATGLQHLACILELKPEERQQPGAIVALLHKYPGNEPLHAWWLQTRASYGGAAQMDAALVRHCLDLFGDRFPALGYLAAMQLARKPGPDQARDQQRALALFQKISETASTFALSAASSLVAETKTWPNAAAWQDAIIAVQERGARELPDIWTLPGRWRSSERSRHDVAFGLLKSLRESQRWEAFARALEEEARHQESAETVMQNTPFAGYGRGGPLLGDEALCFPNVLLRWPHAVLNVLGVFYSPKIRRENVARWGGPWTEMLRDPWLKLIALWSYGDAAAARAEIERRIAAPEAGLTDWWVAAWMAWQSDAQAPNEAAGQNAARLAAERLTRAASFPTEGLVRTHLDAALLRAVLALRERPPELIEAVHAAARRFCEGTLTSTYMGNDLKTAFATLGFGPEAERVTKLPIVPHLNEALVRRPSVGATTTVGRLRSKPPTPAIYDRKPKKPETPEVAVSQALRQLRQVQPDFGMRGLAPRIVEQWKAGGYYDAVVKAAAPREGATARELLRAGLDFEMLGQPQAARRYYEDALRLSPSLDEARARLINFALPEREAEALALLNAMSAEKVGPLLEKLLGSIGPDPRAAGAAAVLSVIMQWLRHLAETRQELPQSAVIPLQTLMLDSRQNRDALCRTALAFPALADIAFGSIAEETLRKKLPLTDVAALAKDRLKTKAGLAGGRRPSYGIQPRTSALPEEGVVEQPGATLILVWDAWQRQAPQELESAILPLLRDAGAANEDAVRVGAALFFCPPDKFTETAGRFVQNDEARDVLTGHSFTDVFARGGTLDFVTLVWRLRKLDVPLDGLFLAELSKPAATSSSLEALATYIGLAEHMTVPQARAFVGGLRDQLVDRDPARRRVLIGLTREDRRYDPALRYQPAPATPNSVTQYVSWLSKLLAEPRTCRAALEMAIEDGLAEDSTWRANNLRHAFWEVEKRSPQHLVALLDGYSILAPARDFRTWAMEPDPHGSLFDTAVGSLKGDGDVSKSALEMVMSRKPETFGTALVFAWAASKKVVNEDERKNVLLRFVTERAAEFELIPADHWPEIGVFLRTVGAWSKPWILSPADRATLAPVIEAERRYLAHFATQVMTADHWEDFRLSGHTFIELSTHAFISAAESDPGTASALAVHVLSLLVKPIKTPGPRSVNTPEDPQLEWIFHAAQTRGALAALRPAVARSEAIARRPQAEREKLERVLGDASKSFPK
ncbi:MAG: hypothetical protein QOE70_3525 [Chthoniobacter sp.]|jgi:tetratricopeptide (TPR) repeat protein|nr:hypothetical protein [Chthoniobacter sp.]